MKKQAILLTILALSTSSCVAGPEGYLKKSANNKYFDMKGFKGGKRTPLYNKKYIAKAKKNVLEEQYADDEYLFDQETEEENIALANREMYREMIRQEMEGESGDSSWFFWKKKRRKYPTTTQASHMLGQRPDYEKEDMKAELDQIKRMLSETKREMASYKCPTAADLEQEHEQLTAKAKAATQPKAKARKPIQPVDIEDEIDDVETVIEPVQSI